LAYKDSKEIAIPSEVYDKLRDRLDKNGASSVDELAARVLRDWITAAEAKPVKNRISRADEAIMEERLKALGYV
jgi:hypothetical protein